MLDLSGDFWRVAADSVVWIEVVPVAPLAEAFCNSVLRSLSRVDTLTCALTCVVGVPATLSEPMIDGL